MTQRLNTSHLVRRSAWAVATLLAVTLAGCGTQMRNPVTGQLQRSVMDEKQEVAIGAQNHEEIIKEYGVYPDPKVQAYVNAIGQKLAKQSHRAELTWHFTVLDSPEINAFALPGGYVYITRGIMAYLDSEADLAGVIGHEIGHVTARHGAQQATHQQTAGLGVLAASVLGAVLEAKGVSGAGQLASDLSQNVAAGLVAKYGRTHETEADALGAEYLSRTQYNPANMVDVIQVLKSQERFAADKAQAEGRPAPSGNSWLASHPSNDQRLQDIRQVAAKYPASDTARYADDGRQRYLNAISGMTFGDSPEQGMVRGQQFVHPGMGFAMTAPASWKVQNTTDTLAIVSPDNTAGLLLKLVPSKASGTHQQVIEQLFQPTQGQVLSTRINGMNATQFRGQRRNEQGQAQNLQFTLVDGPRSRRFILMPSGKDAQSVGRHQAGLQAAEQSFRPISAADEALAKPWLIRTASYPSGGWRQLAQQSPLPAPAEDALRLLNGHYGSNTEPRKGELVKVIGR